MAFSGTELEEVAPTTVGTTCAGGGKVFAIGSGQTAIMDDATSITGSVSSGTSGGDSGYPYYRYLYCHNIATTGDYVWGEWVQSAISSSYYWARLTISTSSVWTSAISYSGYPAGVAIGVGGYMYAAVNWALTARRWSLFQVRAI